MKKKVLRHSKIKAKSTSGTIKAKPRHFLIKDKDKREGHKTKDKKSIQFPNIFRIFTEKHFFVFLILVILSVAISIAFVNLYKDIDRKDRIEKERHEIAKEIEFWKGVVAQYSDYRDAYFNLALLEYRLGDFKGSKFYLEKVLDIDPNFERGRELQEILDQK